MCVYSIENTWNMGEPRCFLKALSGISLVQKGKQTKQKCFTIAFFVSAADAIIIWKSQVL